MSKISFTINVRGLLDIDIKNLTREIDNFTEYINGKIKTCPECGTDFFAKSRGRLVCSKDCLKKRNYKTTKSKSHYAEKSRERQKRYYYHKKRATMEV